jgi:pimeloyl-ACP methyl ester carboxylesterase
MNRQCFKWVLLCAALWLPHSGHAEIYLHDQPVVNGHPGYLSAWAISGELDRVIVIVPGFDTSNSSLPIDELQGDMEPVVTFLGWFGWDVVYLEYVDGSIDLKDNADNLARFIEYLDSRAEPDYHLAVIGGSMGGIVARTMFVQEAASMGVDTFVSIDSPHWGVYLSEWVGDLAVLAIDYPAARQMYNGDPAYEEHYGWLQRVEARPWFVNTVNGPMNTCAITLSDGTRPWEVSWSDELLHNKYYPVASYVEYSGLTSTYMPFHSTAYLDSDATRLSLDWGRNSYEYESLQSSYFDQVIPNPRDEHQAPPYTLLQAFRYIVEHAPGRP